MELTLNTLCDDFGEIRNGDAIDDFVGRYALSPADVEDYPDVRNVQEVYEGMVCDQRITLIHWWHDPSQAFSIQPDINEHKLELRVDGLRTLKTGFPDTV